MFYSIEGRLSDVMGNFAVVETGGVGFKIYTPVNLLTGRARLGESVKFYIYSCIREDAFDLYGFLTTEQQSLFEMVISVSGVGPKVGLAILSSVTPEEFARAVVNGDAKALTGAPGVGLKLAQRIVLELKDKLGKSQYADAMPASVTSAPSVHGDAVAALLVLGYTQADAVVAVNKVEGEHPLEETIRLALKNLAR